MSEISAVSDLEEDHDLHTILALYDSSDLLAKLDDAVRVLMEMVPSGVVEHEELLDDALAVVCGDLCQIMELGIKDPTLLTLLVFLRSLAQSTKQQQHSTGPSSQPIEEYDLQLPHPAVDPAKREVLFAVVIDLFKSLPARLKFLAFLEDDCSLADLYLSFAPLRNQADCGRVCRALRMLPHVGDASDGEVKEVPDEDLEPIDNHRVAGEIVNETEATDVVDGWEKVMTPKIVVSSPVKVTVEAVQFQSPPPAAVRTKPILHTRSRSNLDYLPPNSNRTASPVRQPRRQSFSRGSMPSSLPERTVSFAHSSYFSPPRPGQSLIGYLQSQDTETCADLERENAHFFVSDVIIAAVEQMQYERRHGKTRKWAGPATGSSNRGGGLTSDDEMVMGRSPGSSVGAEQASSPMAEQASSLGAEQAFSLGAEQASSLGAGQAFSLGAEQALSLGAEQASSLGAEQAFSLGAEQALSLGADQASSLRAGQALSLGAEQELSLGAEQASSPMAVAALRTARGLMTYRGMVSDGQSSSTGTTSGSLEEEDDDSLTFPLMQADHSPQQLWSSPITMEFLPADDQRDAAPVTAAPACGPTWRVRATDQPSNSAESIAVSLLRKFSEHHLPNACEMDWLVSESDAPQSLLPLPKGTFISPDSPQREQQGRIRGNLEWAPLRPQVIYHIQPHVTLKVGIVNQKNRCAGCGGKMDAYQQARMRFCEYTGKYFCVCCHEYKTALIPARVLLKWDFTKHYVSNFAADFIARIYRDPLFDVKDCNMDLYKKSKSLALTRSIRSQLVLATEYVRTCRQGGSAMGEIEQLPKFVWEHIHTYSLDLFCSVKDNILPNFIRPVADLAVKHVVNCQFCCSKGFICEFCKDETPLFPFQTNTVFQIGRSDRHLRTPFNIYIPGLAFANLINLTGILFDGFAVLDGVWTSGEAVCS
ncbi:Run domain Beclin-1-interacting and cysteine-rich domain-containing protein [Hypsibius exemplaris]|uniref:Run domain Beclin-1-interacting and cysteine-rich domain-containing protein n=1 Tax=Hypsibius exemplaris TaxID=2072580 RepID=A0A9X6NEY2_HYPEX|nr:Run domain Beclin-1-interacting and cysteine-rich domain-containing protein [Hypsibius exemplaris]